MANRHHKLKKQALTLRAKGLSYNEILRKIPVARSSISLWCRNVPLTPKQQSRLRKKKDGQLKGIKAIQKMFWEKRRLNFIKGAERAKKIRPDTSVKFVAGLMIYWAEGNKGKGPTAITNSDPKIIKFMSSWFGEFFGVSPKNLKIYLNLHSGQDEKRAISFWSKLTRVPPGNFGKSFIKPTGSGYKKNIHYHGTARLTIRKTGSTYLLFQILGSINGFLYNILGVPIKPENWMSKSSYAE